MFYILFKFLLFYGNSKFNEVYDFELFVSVEFLIDYLKSDKFFLVFIYGEFGCGRIIFFFGICDILFERNWFKKFEILGLRVRRGCIMLFLWSFLSEIAKDKLDKDIFLLLL